ncbi:hypothetical protein FQN54_009779 [Arachnomyces sp. PD_36]|nr:hypothetical protein FQN54_009779 [Arachnomyces sp. PD_36]
MSPPIDQEDMETNNRVTRSTSALRPTVSPLDLPYRELNESANFEEFTRETAEGTIVKPVKSNVTGQVEKYKLVTFKIDDEENPKNWSKLYKWYCTMVVAFTCFVVAFNSSVITADLMGVEKSFGVSEEVSLLTITVFVIGFGVGPMVFAPLSEMVGRRLVYGTTLFLALVFIIPCAVAENIGTLIVCRAIDGIAFSAPMTLVGGTLSDLWRNEERGVPMAAFSAAPFVGPAIGPLVGGFLADATGWRWLYWIQLILSGIAWFLITFTVPETYTPTLLARRAKKMRKAENDSRYVTEQEIDSRPIGEKLRIFFFRPFQLLFLEPIVFLLSLYMSVLYGLLYMYFVAYPIVYEKGKAIGGWPVGFGFIFLYNSCNNYLVDTYQHQAASALAAKTFLRSIWGASVVLFTNQMYNRLGYQWASSLIAFIALACCAIPFLFFYYGEAIRKHSKFAFVEDEENKAVEIEKE